MNSTKSAPAQLVNFILGTTPIIAYLGLVVLVLSNLPRTPLVYATATVGVMPGTYIVFGIHELGHHVTAEDYCGFSDVYFSTFKNTLLPTLLSFFVALALVVIDTFGVYPIPTWAFLLGLLSPGAVVMKGQSKRSSCSDEAALGGILLGALPGLLIWWQTDVGIPAMSMDLPTFMLASTMVLSLGLSVFNSLPLPGLDGYHVLRMGDPDTVFPLILSAGFCSYALLTIV